MKKTAFIATIIIIIDRITKLFIVKNFDMHESKEIIHNFLYITRAENNGAAFSIFEGKIIFIIIISILMIGALITLYKKEKSINTYKIIMYSLLFGGVIGNFIDRIFYGYVIDFIDTYIFGYNFPIFNIADTAIVCGTILLLYEIIIKGEKHEN